MGGGFCARGVWRTGFLDDSSTPLVFYSEETKENRSQKKEKSLTTLIRWPRDANIRTVS